MAFFKSALAAGKSQAAHFCQKHFPLQIQDSAAAKVAKGKRQLVKDKCRCWHSPVPSPQTWFTDGVTHNLEGEF
jgi:hypothetical protein